jgi:DNA sulfur modification protein DndB
MRAFEYTFAAMRGVQAGREYYVTMCPLSILPSLLKFVKPDLPPELRAQRLLNRGRIPEITRYLTDNPKDYILSSLTASIDGDVVFEPLGRGADERAFGRLHIPMQATVLVQDGQHRHAAIIEALKKRSDLGDDTISVVFFVDVGLQRSQQMFADLNRYAIRTTSSLGLLYDHRDDDAMLVKEMLRKVPVFQHLTELERSSISNRSVKLFTLSGIYHATQTLMAGVPADSQDEKIELAAEFWRDVATRIPAWTLANSGKANPAELRKEFVHAHALALAALGRVGNALLLTCTVKERRAALAKLATVDWRRSNSKVWEGRAMNAGRLSKKTINVTLVGNWLKKHLGLALSDAEQEVEQEFRRSKNGSVAKVG